MNLLLVVLMVACSLQSGCGCEDWAFNCELMLSMNRCYNIHTRRMCQYSCQACNEDLWCVNSSWWCDFWAAHGECQYPDRRKICPKSCKTC